MPFTVESWRGTLLESVHHVAVAVVDRDGRTVAGAGGTTLRTVLRSSAKPFQAMPLVEDGVVERFRLTTRELAITCASHNGEPEHVAVVRGLLEKIGCAESDLVCGPHRSLAEDLGVAEESSVPVADIVPPRSPIGSNCSGKHAGMLALARHHGWPTAGYQRADHPVQQRVKRALAEWTGTPAGDIGEAVDGCGVMCFALPLRALALGFARLVSDPAAAPIADAMRRHPDLVAGRNRLCTALMQRFPGVLAKVGAEGVYGAAWGERGLGIAIKVLDGHNRAANVALIAVLEQLGLKPSPTAQLPRFATWQIRNTRGETVGQLRASGSLSFD